MDPGIEARTQQKIERYLEDNGAARGESDWRAAYDQINQKLQAADLTINFEAADWFSRENTYETYTQMYERAGTIHDRVSGEQKTFLKSVGTNFAGTRAAADDKVTFPAHWKGQEPAHRGLRPGAQNGQAIMKQMEFGSFRNHKQASLDTPGAMPIQKGIVPDNSHFNPKTKQLFAALNFGRCPNGGAMTYGKSYFVLADKIKLNAIYFGDDTFGVTGKSNAAQNQMPYSNLAALLGTEGINGMVAWNIFMCCLGGKRLTDTSGNAILEAHLFQNLEFTGNIKEVMVAEKDPTSQIAENARLFARKHGVKLYFINS